MNEEFKDDENNSVDSTDEIIDSVLGEGKDDEITKVINQRYGKRRILSHEMYDQLAADMLKVVVNQKLPGHELFRLAKQYNLAERTTRKYWAKMKAALKQGKHSVSFRPCKKGRVGANKRRRKELENAIKEIPPEKRTTMRQLKAALGEKGLDVSIGFLSNLGKERFFRKLMQGDKKQIPQPKSDVDFENLPWNLNMPEFHSYVHITTKSVWDHTHYDPSNDSGSVVSSIRSYTGSGSLPIYPACTSLNYGTTVWEGLKCYRDADGYAIVFRPDMNYKRFCDGAEAMCLPAPSIELFMRGLQSVIQNNATLIPPHGDGMKLYIRPILYGSGQQLGLYPSSEFSMLFYASPTGNFLKGNSIEGLKLHLETFRSRASRGGTGRFKCSGNYASLLKPLQDANLEGFNDNLYLELETYHSGKLKDAIIQELSAANIFLVLNTGEIVTPSLSRGTVLPGVIRDSILVLAKHFSEELKEAMIESTGNPNATITVQERDIKVREFKNACEVFVTGTASEILPVQSLSTGRKDKEKYTKKFRFGKNLPGGPVTKKLFEILKEVVYGRRTCPAPKGWLVDPFGSPEEFRYPYV